MELSRWIENADEKPLEQFPVNGGFCGILRTVGCIGDSLSSGEFERHEPDGSMSFFDCFDYSWGQFFARMTGNTVYNFSRGGMTAREYLESFAEANGFWAPEKACRAYIIALGVNDLLNLWGEVGSLEDIDLEDPSKNKPTFTGYYAAIVQRLKQISPQAKFFFMTMPVQQLDADREKLADLHAVRMHELAGFFENSYVLDFRAYAPVNDTAFRERFYLNGHLNPCGYALTGHMVTAYIDYIIRHNMNDFREIGLIGEQPWLKQPAI